MSAKKSTDQPILRLVPVQEFAPIPGLVVPLSTRVSQKGHSAIIEAAAANEKVFLCFQSGKEGAAAGRRNLAPTGGIAEILRTITLPNGDMQTEMHVIERASIEKFESLRPLITVRLCKYPRRKSIRLAEEDKERIDQLRRIMSQFAEHDVSVAQHLDLIVGLYHPGELADVACSLLNLEAAEAQRIVEELDFSRRLELALEYALSQSESHELTDRFASQAETAVDRERQHEVLRQQMRLIRAELGEGDEFERDISDLSLRLEKNKMPANARREAERQLRRLRQLHPDSAEAALVRTYLDWVADLPWSNRSRDRLDLKEACKILDEDHYGLDKAKERILDFLGVRSLKAGGRGPILLFVGPPGVGKTSLGRSIARALNRRFVRIALGGLRDEAELRGHRRTYVGALPGRIVQALKTSATKNPVFMLDEIDKIGSEFRGDPSAVLLEVLDPEQNSSFEDHYLNLPFDLSEVMFICTANITDSIPSPLLDRMEVIEINGYTEEEKLQIAKKYLLAREIEECGISDLDLRLPDKTLLHIMNGYTKESGVRELRRRISTVLRKIARMVAEKTTPPKVITPKLVQRLLGPVIYVPDRRLQEDEIGVATGLAWTSVGGETLTIEVSRTKGKGVLSLTGQLGEVMRESAMAALTYVLANADRLGVDAESCERSNIHVHVPEGAIAKDGPSAGTAIAVAILSVLTSRPVARDVAMTGEITLRGSVLPIGGLREKALAALRAGISTVVIPKENERELVEFPKYLRERVRFVPVRSIDGVFQEALRAQPKAEIQENLPRVARPRVRNASDPGPG